MFGCDGFSVSKMRTCDLRKGCSAGEGVVWMGVGVVRNGSAAVRTDTGMDGTPLARVGADTL